MKDSQKIASLISDALNELEISYDIHTHDAVFTVDEASVKGPKAEAGETKNLFLRNKNGSKHFLIIAYAHSKIDLKKICDQLHIKKLSFASSERLMRYLQVTPGAVSPFGLIFDENNEVEVIVDTKIFEFDTVGFHPNDNTKTLIIRSRDLKVFLSAYAKSVRFMTFDHS